jgi:hypothetical protein
MLRRRGLDLFRQNPIQHLFFPPALPPEEKQKFYELFKKYSFRLYLREILIRRGRFRVSEVVRFSTPETGKKYLQFLMEMGLAEPAGFQYRLGPDPPPASGPPWNGHGRGSAPGIFLPGPHGRCRGGRCGETMTWSF